MENAAVRSRRRSVPESPSTRELILDAAERLFALHGVDGASLRQIGLAAGSLNSFSVQYHFGDKSRLIRAIFERRMPELEARRAALLAEATARGELHDPRALLEVMFMPLSEALDADGRSSYANFVLSLYERDALEPWLDAFDLAPLSSHLCTLLHGSTGIPLALSKRRLRATFIMFLYAVRAWDRALSEGADTGGLLTDAIDMAAAALLTPPGPKAAAVGA